MKIANVIQRSDIVITPNELTAIYSFANAVKIPLSDVVKFVEKYQRNIIVSDVKSEIKLNKYVSKIESETKNREDRDFSDIFDTLGLTDFDVPKTILNAYNSTKEV